MICNYFATEKVKEVCKYLELQVFHRWNSHREESLKKRFGTRWIMNNTKLEYKRQQIVVAKNPNARDDDVISIDSSSGKEEKEVESRGEMEVERPSVTERVVRAEEPQDINLGRFSRRC